MLFFAIAGILLVYPWNDLLPAKYANWEQITIIRAAVLLFTLLRLSLTAARKKLSYRLYSMSVIIFLFIWVFTSLMLKKY